MSVHYLCVWCHRGQKKASDLELWIVVSCQVGAGIELGSSGKATSRASEAGLRERVTSMQLLPAWGWMQGPSTVTALTIRLLKQDHYSLLMPACFAQLWLSPS